MKIIAAIVLYWICLSSCKKVSRQCIHKIGDTNDEVKFPGMKFNDEANNIFTEGRRVKGICIIHGKISENKQLILNIGPSVAYKNWISIGGRISKYGDWKNMVLLYYNYQGLIDMDIDHEYRTFTRDGKNGTKEILLSGYKFDHLRIVFPRQQTNFTITYSWTNYRKACKPLPDIVDIVTCTKRKKVNSVCTVKCKTGFAPSPILYERANDEIKTKLPLMSTTCRGNGFEPPDWFPKIASTYYELSFKALPCIASFIPTQMIPIQIVAPEVKEWYHAVLIKPNFDDMWKEDVINSHKCVDLENIADACFRADPIFVTDGIMNFRLDKCHYPNEYVLELFGEDGDTGVDPDTIPIPTQPTPKDRIQQMDSEAKLHLLLKVIEQRETYTKYLPSETESPCIVDEYEDLYNVLRKQATTSKIDNIWNEFKEYADKKCFKVLSAGWRPHCSYNICEMVELKLIRGGTAHEYKYKCASFKEPGRRGECIICRHGKNKLCQTLKVYA
uniref:uncharacterized protein LOC120339968 n=1 Tax=Styela clava TaxID=7725 RepID=UPI001939DEE9|nr:uncharacterized protein LOC120339968 [Styela clava]